MDDDQDFDEMMVGCFRVGVVALAFIVVGAIIRFGYILLRGGGP